MCSGGVGRRWPIVLPTTSRVIKGENRHENERVNQFTTEQKAAGTVLWKWIAVIRQ